MSERGKDLPSKLSTSWEEAKRIFGHKAIGIDTATKLGIKIPSDETPLWNTIPFTHEELEFAHQQDFTLLALPEINCSDLLHLPNNQLGLYIDESEPFFYNTVIPGYSLIRNPTPVKEYLPQYFIDQNINIQLLSAIYRSPLDNPAISNGLSLASTAETLYLFCAYHLENKQIYSNLTLRTSDHDELGWNTLVEYIEHPHRKVQVSSDDDLCGYHPTSPGYPLIHLFRSLELWKFVPPKDKKGRTYLH